MTIWPDFLYFGVYFIPKITTFWFLVYTRGQLITKEKLCTDELKNAPLTALRRRGLRAEGQLPLNLNVGEELFLGHLYADHARSHHPAIWACARADIVKPNYSCKEQKSRITLANPLWG